MTISTTKYFDSANSRFKLNLKDPVASLFRDPANAIDVDNFESAERGGIVSRKGFHIHAEDSSYGLFNYVYIDTNGVLNEELVTVNANLNKISSGSVTVTYSGSNDAYINITVESGVFHFKLYDNESAVLDYNMGTGKEDPTTVLDLSDLKAAVDAVANFSCTVSGTNTVPAAFIEPVARLNLTSAQTLTFYYATQISTPVEDPFQTYVDLAVNDDFENVSFVNHKNCLYMGFPSASLRLFKYDGVNVYKAGLPQGEGVNSQNRVAAGNITGAVQYFTTFVYTDAVGNSIEGEDSSKTSSLTLTSENLDLTLNTLNSTSGYNTNCAISYANQTVASSGGSVVLSVHNGAGGAQTLVVGDTAYLYNRSTSAYSTYVISAASANSITVTSAETIQLNLGDVISANLRIAIYRNQSGGSNYYLVAEIPNNSFQDTTTYTDSTADVSANALFVTPVKTPNIPPVAHFLATHGDSLIIARQNSVRYSDEGSLYGSSEIFPDTDNQIDIFSGRGGIIRAMGNSGNLLIIFGENFCKGLEGNLTIDQFRVFDISNHLGCVSSQALASLDSSLVFLSETGVHVITDGSLESRSLSTDINNLFHIKEYETARTLTLRKSVMINDIGRQQLLLFLPRSTTSYSDLMVYDYRRKSWFKWSEINMTGGAVYKDSKLWFHDRSYLYKFKNSGKGIDYYDHEADIDCVYLTGWETLGEPGLPKKARWIKPYTVLTDDIDSLSSFTLTIKSYLDYLSDWVHSTLVITRTSMYNEWGFPWGQVFGSPLEVCPKRKLRSGKARALQLRFEATSSGAPTIITGWEIVWALLYSSGGNE